MAEVPKDFRSFAGRVVFPRSPWDLVSTTLCPACQFPLESSTECQVCGLDLSNPAALQLLSLATEAAAIMDHRLELIGRIRWESASATAPEPVATENLPLPEPVQVREPAPEQAQVRMPAQLHAPLKEPQLLAANAPAEPRRSSVQVALLIVGISLLSIAAIFFLIYAFITFGLLARSLIVGGITVASIVTASVLRRRSLPNTAEGIAVFGMVLVYLDAWALRANDFFALGSGDGSIYWGWVLVVSAVLLVAWNRLSGIRAPSVVAFGVFAPGVGLLAGPLAAPSDRLYVTFTAIALAGVVQRFAGRPARTERVISLATTSLALAVGAGAAFLVAPDAQWASAFALAVIGFVGLANVIAIDFRGGTRTVERRFGSIFAAIAAASTAAAFGAAALRSSDPWFIGIAPAVFATAIALAFERGIRFAAAPVIAFHRRVWAVSAGVVAALCLVFPVSTLLVLCGQATARGLGSAWQLGGTEAIVPASIQSTASAIALVASTALVALAWTASRVFQSRAAIISWGCVAAALLVAPIGHLLVVVIAVWAIIAAGALLALILAPRAPRHALTVALLAAMLLGYATSWASEDTWGATTVFVIVVLLLARLAFRSTLSKAVLLGAAVVTATVGAAAAARNLALPLHPSGIADVINVARATGFLAILLLGLDAIVPSKKLSALDRQVVFWLTASTLVVSGLLSQFSLHAIAGQLTGGLLLPEYLTSLVVGVFLLAALSTWVVGLEVVALRAERLVVAVLLAPAAAFAIDALARVVAASGLSLELAPVIAAVIAAGLGLTLSLARPGFASRLAVDLGTAIVAVPAIATAVVLPTSSTWLVFELGALAALVLATGRDGLFRSASRRKHVGWVALALATGGLWWQLGTNGVTAIEPWVLPLSGAVLIIALLTWIAGRRSDADGGGAENSSGAVAVLTLAALLISVVPLALEASPDTLARPIVVGAISALLLLFSCIVRPPSPSRQLLDGLAIAGVIGTVLVTVVQSVAQYSSGAYSSGAPDARLDIWLAASFIVLTTAGLSLSHSRADSRPHAVAAEGLLALALLELVVLELPASADTALGFSRTLVIVLALCVVHVVSLARGCSPFTTRIGWGSIGLAALAGSVGLSVRAFHDVEWAAVPIAVALIVTGALQLRRSPTAGSWPCLAPGVLLLLVPSLVTTAWDAPVWRLVGLGVVGVAIIVGSVILKLQAPFLVGSVVVLIHAIATFSPEIRAVYQAVEWWVWLAIGGIVIVVVSIRFEKSRKGVLRLVSSLAGLR